ncbi:nitrilase-related carbon-nitrogen hydrolase, partial [Vibrio breoganii]
HVYALSRGDIEALAEPVPNGESTQKLVSLATQFGMSVGAGLIEQGTDGELYNTYVFAMPNGEVQKHRKLHTFVS